MGYDVGGASVMDYQALFQESIQQETLLEEHLGVSFETAGTPPDYRGKTHPPVTGCPCAQRILIQSLSSNWIAFISLFSVFFFSLDLSMRVGLRRPTDCKRPFHSSYIDCRKASLGCLILSQELMHSCICTADKWINGQKKRRRKRKKVVTCIKYWPA